MKIPDYNETARSDPYRSANRVAMARPMPRDAPVMRTRMIATVSLCTFYIMDNTDWISSLLFDLLHVGVRGA